MNHRLMYFLLPLASAVLGLTPSVHSLHVPSDSQHIGHEEQGARSTQIGAADDIDLAATLGHEWSLSALLKHGGPYGPESPTVLGSPGDWFFSAATPECNGQVVHDNTPQTAFSRVLLPLLFTACVFAILGMSLATNDDAKDSTLQTRPAAESDQPPEGTVTAGSAASVGRSSGGRCYYADFARICAIGCVIFEHCGGTSYTYRNVGFGLWWALPYLYMTSGMMRTLSRSSMDTYLLRLLCVLLVGVSANLAADVVSGRKWKTDFANTVFQMWFVVMLMGMAVLMEPVRCVLLQRSNLRRERPEDNQEETEQQLPTFQVKLGLVVYGFVTVASLMLFAASWILPDDVQAGPKSSKSEWIRFYAPMLQSMPLLVVQVVGPAFLVTWAGIALAPRFFGHIGWLLLALLYGSKVLMPFDLDGFPHLLGLYVVSMVAAVWPLTGSKHIAAAVKNYWPFMFMALCLLALPDMIGRCDVHPPGLLWERLRFNTGEFVMVLLFCTGALECDDPYHATIWMGFWSLYAYCFHVCFYRLFGSPAAAMIVFSSILPFYLLYRQGFLGGVGGASKAAAVPLPK